MLSFSRVGCCIQAAILLLSMPFGCTSSAGDWPQFRGPQASGLDTNSPAPVRWDVEKRENIRWEQTIPGLGHSSPILWKDRLYLTTAVYAEKAELKVGLYGNIESANEPGPQEWHLLALDRATGKVIWDKVGHTAIPRVKRHPKSSHCSSTPAIAGTRIVAIFGSEGLFCFGMNGDLVWQKDLGPMAAGYYVVPSAQWGFASSPIILDGKVVVLCDVLTNSFLAVFDLRDGKEIWRTPREDVPTWGTPTVARVGQQWQILINGWHHTGAYDFATGKEIWKLNGGGDIPVPTPVIANGLAYFTSAHGRARPIRAIRLNAQGDITPERTSATNTAIVWVHERQGNYMQTPIVTGNNVYACLDNGILSCFDSRTGAIHYSERLGSGNEGFSASPVSDGRHLFLTSELGAVYVIPVDDKFSVAAVNELGATCMATPALCDGTLFFRTRDRLIAVGQ